jgi:transposase-like protein
MSTASNPYRGFRFPADIINQAVWLYHCFSLSLRDIELILARVWPFLMGIWERRAAKRTMR